MTPLSSATHLLIPQTGSETHMKVKLIISVASLIGCASLLSCGSNWRIHEEERAIPSARVQTAAAPEWVQGTVPILQDRVYFIGRSSTPDMPRQGGLRRGATQTTPDGRTGFTVMDEREAIQSARTDVQDQIMQRLMPRNFGTTAQVLTSNIDVGNCASCGTVIPTVSTPWQRSANEPSYRDPCNASTNSGQVKCAKCLAVGPTLPGALISSGSCPDPKKFNYSGSGPGSLVSQLTEQFRTADFVPMMDHQIARDINLLNLGLDSVLPALLAQLQEESVYFEKWAVHEGDDENRRINAEGFDEWQSYKCWVLCSIPRSEFMKIADEFRTRYEELYQLTIERNESDRTRRIVLEDLVITTELKYQAEERKWNRADEELALDHAVTLDKDRERMPGRRFTPVAPQTSTP